jgi:ubiquinone/menaquinone biosynthesis C-methylase UbiE
LKNRDIQRFFDELAPEWEESVCGGHAERLIGIAETLPIQAGETALDVGCGTGLLTPLLQARTGRRGRTLAFDLSREMLRLASARRPQDRPAYLQADVLDLPFAAETFDWAVCNSVVPHFADQQRGFSELARCLKPGGRLVICHTQSRKAIDALHASIGGTVGEHRLPMDAELSRLLRNAGLALARFEDTPERFIAVAERR